jgi:hypothetical protein
MASVSRLWVGVLVGLGVIGLGVPRARAYEPGDMICQASTDVASWGSTTLCAQYLNPRHQLDPNGFGLIQVATRDDGGSHVTIDVWNGTVEGAEICNGTVECRANVGPLVIIKEADTHDEVDYDFTPTFIYLYCTCN